MFRVNLINIGFPLGKRVLLKHPLAIFGMVAVCVGAFLFLTGLIIYAAVGDREGRLISLFAVSGQGIIWWIIGAVCAFISRRSSRKLEMLRHEGRCYDAEISNVQIVAGINIGFTPAIRAECIYTNENGQRCKVKSPMFLWRSLDPNGLKATVFTDYNDPGNYAVEIALNEENPSQNQPPVDIDYT